MLFRSLVVALGLGLALEVLASPLLRSDDAPRKRDVTSTHAIHERHTPRMSQQWAKRDKLPGTAVLPIRIGLKQSNLDAGHDRLMEM
jgi:tripeptidyl-peptidase I